MLRWMLWLLAVPVALVAASLALSAAGQLNMPIGVWHVIWVSNLSTDWPNVVTAIDDRHLTLDDGRVLRLHTGDLPTPPELAVGHRVRVGPDGQTYVPREASFCGNSVPHQWVTIPLRRIVIRSHWDQGTSVTVTGPGVTP